MMSNDIKLKRGDVVLVKLEGKGSEQVGLRPCIVTSNDACNKFSPVISVVPLTSKLDKRSIPTHMIITTDMYPIHRDSTVLAEQSTRIDKQRICSELLFRLNEVDMKRLDRIVAIQWGLGNKAV